MFCSALASLELSHKMSILFLHTICSGTCCDFHDLLPLPSTKVFIFINSVLVSGDSSNMGARKREADAGPATSTNINLNICSVSNDGGICGCLPSMKSCLTDRKEEHL